MANELIPFVPMFPDDDEAAILARFREWANEGLDPAVDADQWVDTREGSYWYIAVMPAVRELARLYDLAGTEVPASGFPLFAWSDYLDAHAEVQTLTRLAATRAEGIETFSGAEGTVIPAGVQISAEPATPDDDVPTFEVTTGGAIGASGELDLPIRALEAGEFGNVSATALSDIGTPLTGPGGEPVTATNAGETKGGTDDESDEGLRERVLAAFIGEGAGNVRDYERWARAWEGVGRVTVIPLWNGAGTVKVVVTTAEGQPVSQSTVDGLQADLDPDAGKARGRAPIGAIVTVTTAVAVPINVSGTIEFESGYSLDGDGGTVAVRDAIEQALAAYIARVDAGGEVVLSQVAGRIVTVVGVHDVSNVQINGVAGNRTIDDDPAEVATPGTHSFTLAA